MGLEPSDNVLVLSGDGNPLTGTIADLHGKHELAVVGRANSESTLSSPAQRPIEEVFLRIKLETLPGAIHCATIVCVYVLITPGFTPDSHSFQNAAHGDTGRSKHRMPEDEGHSFRIYTCAGE